MKASPSELAGAVLALYSESDHGLSLLEHPGGQGLPAVVIMVARHREAMAVLKEAYALLGRSAEQPPGAQLGSLIVPLRSRNRVKL